MPADAAVTDGKAGLERLWLLIALSAAYIASMTIILAFQKPHTTDVWSAVAALLLLATEITIAVLSWRDIVTFGGLMPWRKIPVALRVVIVAAVLGAFVFVWPGVIILLPPIQIIRGFVDLPKAHRARMARHGNEIADGLAKELASVENRLPADTKSRLDSIAATIDSLLPRAAELSPKDAFIVRRTATDYLPVALNTYLKIPATSAKGDQNSPLRMLNEDLDLMQQKLGEIADAIHRSDSEALAVHTRFLEEKFGRQDVTLQLPGKD